MPPARVRSRGLCGQQAARAVRGSAKPHGAALSQATSSLSPVTDSRPSPLTRPPLRSGHPLPGGERRAVPPAWGARSRTPAAGGERRAVPPARVRSRGLLRPAGRPSAPWRRRASRRSAPPRPPSSVKPSLGSCSKGPFKPSHRNASPLHARSREATLPSVKGDRHGVELALEDTTRRGGGAAAEERSAARLPGLCRAWRDAMVAARFHDAGPSGLHAEPGGAPGGAAGLGGGGGGAVAALSRDGRARHHAALASWRGRTSARPAAVSSRRSTAACCWPAMPMSSWPRRRAGRANCISCGPTG